MFKIIDGPVHHWFCAQDCSQKWLHYRHMIGVAHVVKLEPALRAAYLKGKSIDEFISNGMVIL